MLRLIAILMMLVVWTLPARADGQQATHALFANLARSHANVGVSERNVRVAPSLVRGLYVLLDNQGNLVGYTNDAGTLYGDSRGFNYLSPTGGAPQPLSVSEINALRAEIMADIDYDKLIKVSYGNGGGRRLLMFSDVDCPSCKGLEDFLRTHVNSLNTTFYIVPGSLGSLRQGDERGWEYARRIWCSDNNSEAWQTYWIRGVTPTTYVTCRFDSARTAETAVMQLRGILMAVGVRITGTPQIVREDGMVQHIPSRTVAYVENTFGPDARPFYQSAPRHWLDAGEGGFEPQAVDAPAQPVAARTGAGAKINLGDALKKFLK